MKKIRTKLMVLASAGLFAFQVGGCTVMDLLGQITGS